MNAHEKLLTAVSRHPESTQTKLSRATGLTESSVTSNLSILREKGLIVEKPSTGSADLIKEKINEDRDEEEEPLEVKWAVTGKGRSRLNKLHKEKIEELLEISEALSMPWFRPPSQGSEAVEDNKNMENNEETR